MCRFALPVLMMSVLAPASTLAQNRAVDSVTVPMRIEGDRAFVDLTFTRKDGTARSARFWIDTGGDAFLLTEALARDLGLTLATPEKRGSKAFAPVTPAPQPFLGDMPLELVASRVLFVVASDNLLPRVAPGHADGIIPGHVLARYHVILDYPNRSFTLAKPGVIEPKGEPLRMPVSAHMRFPRTEIEVAGTKYGLLLDTGASFTVVSEAVLKAWGNHHPRWARYPGAVGDAKMLGAHPIETMIVQGGHWGSYDIHDIGVVSQPKGTFERYMSSMMAEPIIGSLGGNILGHFRIELDYAKQMLYLSQPAAKAGAP